MRIGAIVLVNSDQADDADRDATGDEQGDLVERWKAFAREIGSESGGSVRLMSGDDAAITTLASHLGSQPQRWTQQSLERDAPPPAAMSAAEFVWLDDGRPDWGSMWTTFCELALYGGPPHRGADNPVLAGATGLDPAPELNPVAEIQRGIFETTGLVATRSEPGWLSIACTSSRMAAWLCASIILENVEARCQGNQLFVPADPSFGLKDEVKSVVTVLAKTHHYWEAHLAAASDGRLTERIPADELLTGPPLLDIGDDIGALILYAEEADFRREIEVSPASAANRRLHTAIHRRLIQGDVLYVGVYPELPAGTYTIWGGRPDQPATVVVEGGRVATIDWRPA